MSREMIKYLLIALSVFLVSCDVQIPEANSTNCNDPTYDKIMDSLTKAQKMEFAGACARQSTFEPSPKKGWKF